MDRTPVYMNHHAMWIPAISQTTQYLSDGILHEVGLMLYLLNNK